MDYTPFQDMPDTKALFMTDRGSTYALFGDQTTQRNRSGERHEDKSTGMQPRSGKTVFLDLDSMNRVIGKFKREDMATRFVPVLDNEGKPTGKAKLELLQDHKSLRAGTVLAEVPYSIKPAVGMYPVEIMRSDSPIGERGRGIHFGNKIIEVVDRIKSATRTGGGGGMLPTDIEKVPGKRQLKMAAGGMVDKPISGNWKIL